LSKQKIQEGSEMQNTLVFPPLSFFLSLSLSFSCSIGGRIDEQMMIMQTIWKKPAGTFSSQSNKAFYQLLGINGNNSITIKTYCNIL